jgi:hypothetical protein
MEAVPPSETSVNFYRTTRRRTPEDCVVRIHHCENLRSSIAFDFIYMHSFKEHAIKYSLVLKNYEKIQCLGSRNEKRQTYNLVPGITGSFEK